MVLVLTGHVLVRTFGRTGGHRPRPAPANPATARTNQRSSGPDRTDPRPAIDPGLSTSVEQLRVLSHCGRTAPGRPLGPHTHRTVGAHRKPTDNTALSGTCRHRCKNLCRSGPGLCAAPPGTGRRMAIRERPQWSEAERFRSCPVGSWSTFSQVR